MQLLTTTESFSDSPTFIENTNCSEQNGPYMSIIVISEQTNDDKQFSTT